MGEAVLVEALRPPVSRQVFDAAVAEVCEARRLSRGGDSGEVGSFLPPFIS